VNRGYVKVWRKIEDSGLIQLPNTLALFMHLLLNATHKDRKVGTSTGVIELKRGQYISGRIELAGRLKQTEQQIRTSLKRLEELLIITITSTNKYSIYTIENYSKYQDDQEANNQQTNQQITNKQPADNQQITTKQTLKHLNIKEKNIEPLALLVSMGVSEDVAKDFITLRKNLKAPITKTSINGIVREAAKVSYTLEAALVMCCERSWRGFKAEWLIESKNGEKAKGVSYKTDPNVLIEKAKELGLSTNGLTTDQLVSRINDKLGVK